MYRHVLVLVNTLAPSKQFRPNIALHDFAQAQENRVSPSSAPVGMERCCREHGLHALRFTLMYPTLKVPGYKWNVYSFVPTKEDGRHPFECYQVRATRSCEFPEPRLLVTVCIVCIVTLSHTACFWWLGRGWA